MRILCALKNELHVENRDKKINFKGQIFSSALDISRIERKTSKDSMRSEASLAWIQSTYTRTFAKEFSIVNVNNFATILLNEIIFYFIGLWTIVK